MRLPVHSSAALLLSKGFLQVQASLQTTVLPAGLLSRALSPGGAFTSRFYKSHTSDLTPDVLAVFQLQELSPTQHSPGT